MAYLVIRRLGLVEEVMVPSPAYLAEHGTSSTPGGLGGHHMVGFVSSRTSQPLPLEFNRDGEIIKVALPARLLVNGANTNASAARLGLSLARTGAAASLRR